MKSTKDESDEKKENSFPVQLTVLKMLQGKEWEGM